LSVPKEDRLTVLSVPEEDRLTVLPVPEDDKLTVLSVPEEDGLTVLSVKEEDRLTFLYAPEEDNLTLWSVPEKDKLTVLSIPEEDKLAGFYGEGKLTVYLSQRKQSNFLVCHRKSQLSCLFLTKLMPRLLKQTIFFVSYVHVHNNLSEKKVCPFHLEHLLHLFASAV
jgi:hypothetical protein